MMRKLLKKIFGFILIPFFNWYLKRKRKFKYDDVEIVVYPGVFHPGLFHSTKFILKFLKTLSLTDQKFLELGCGTGLISVFASKRRARVTASDISELALLNTTENARINSAKIEILKSNLFDDINDQFDFVVINPPYYKKAIAKESDYAWNAGENLEYFRMLFDQLRSHVTPNAQVLMVLTKGCDLESIQFIAEEKNYSMEMTAEEERFFDDRDYLFRIRSNSSASARV